MEALDDVANVQWSKSLWFGRYKLAAMPSRITQEGPCGGSSTRKFRSHRPAQRSNEPDFWKHPQGREGERASGWGQLVVEARLLSRAFALSGPPHRKKAATCAHGAWQRGARGRGNAAPRPPLKPHEHRFRQPPLPHSNESLQLPT